MRTKKSLRPGRLTIWLIPGLLVSLGVHVGIVMLLAVTPWGIFGAAEPGPPQPLDLPLVSLCVAVRAEIDVRGTLCVDPSVPVGFQKMVITVDVCLGDDIAAQALTMLLAATEHSCVVFQTLRGGVEIEVRCPNDPASARHRAGLGSLGTHAKRPGPPPGDGAQ